MAGFAKVLASQASPCPGPARQSPRLRIRGGRRGRTELDAAPCPDRGEPAMRARAGYRYGEPLGRSIPAQQVLRTARPAEVAGGCSRRPERRGWHASRWGTAAHAGRPVAALAAGTGHRRPIGAGHRGLGGAWSGVGVLVTCRCHRAAGAVASGPVGSAPSGRAAAGGLPAGNIPAGGGPACAARAVARRAPDSSLQGSALAPQHGAGAREQDWGVP